MNLFDTIYQILILYQPTWKRTMNPEHTMAHKNKRTKQQGPAEVRV